MPDFTPYNFQRWVDKKLYHFGFRALIACEAGLGKTSTTLWAITRRWENPAIVVVCPKVAVHTWENEAWNHFRLRSTVYSGFTPPEVGKRIGRRRLHIINYESLAGQRREEKNWQYPWQDFFTEIAPELVVCDECFPYNTPVMTEEGEIPIGKIVEGKLPVKVLSRNLKTGTNEYKEIQYYFTNKRRWRLVTIKHETGTLLCTENHRVWTENRGYVTAGELQSGDTLHTITEKLNTEIDGNSLQILQKNVPDVCKQPNRKTGKVKLFYRMRKRKPKKNPRSGRDELSVLRYVISGREAQTRQKNLLLQSGVFRQMVLETAWFQRENSKGQHSRTCQENKRKSRCMVRIDGRYGILQRSFSAYDRTQSWRESGNYCQMESNKNTERIATYLERETRGKWQIYTATTSSLVDTWKRFQWVENGFTDQNRTLDTQRQIWVSNNLQSGYRKPKIKDWNRNRWSRTSRQKESNNRPKETKKTRTSRVVSITIHERRNQQQYSNSIESHSTVYCLEIQDNHNFFANGVLVSNSQNLSSLNSAKTKAVFLLCQNVPHVLCLSGTPLLNRAKDLFPTLHLLRPDLYPNFYRFAYHYCDMKRKPWGVDVSGSSNLDLLYEEISAALLIRVRKSDVLTQLPAKIRTVVPLELTDRKQYDKARNDFVGWLAEHKPEKMTRALKAAKLSQLGVLKHLTAQLKHKAVCEWIDLFLANSDEKLIYFGHHIDVLETLYKRYEKCSVLVMGKVSHKDRELAQDQLKRSKKIRILFGNLKAAGTAWSAKGIKNVAIGELWWNPATHEQAEDRAHGLERGVEGEPTNIFYLIGHRTIESRLLEILQDKRETANAAIDGGNSGERFSVYDLLCEYLEGEGNEKS